MTQSRDLVTWLVLQWVTVGIALSILVVLQFLALCHVITIMLYFVIIQVTQLMFTHVEGSEVERHCLHLQNGVCLFLSSTICTVLCVLYILTFFQCVFGCPKFVLIFQYMYTWSICCCFMLACTIDQTINNCKNKFVKM